MKPLILLLIAISCSAWAVDPSRLLVLGDSLTEGLGVSREAAYPTLLEKMIKARGGPQWVVINAGISGSTSASGPSRLEWQLKNKPKILILALGANDGLRGLKVSETQKNLAKTIEMAQKAGIQVVVAGMQLPPNYGTQYRQEFAAMYKNLSQQYHTLQIAFLLEGVAGNPQLNQADGIHPNERGHAIVAETVFKAIKDLL